MVKNPPATVYTWKPQNRVHALTVHFDLRRDFKQLRADRKESATQFGVTIGTLVRGKKYSRPYIKKLEGGSAQFTPEIVRAFHELRARTPSTKKYVARKEKFVTLFSSYRVPAEIHARMRPRRCRGHRHFHYMQATQVYCGRTDKERAECKKLYNTRRRNAYAYSLRRQQKTRRRK